MEHFTHLKRLTFAFSTFLYYCLFIFITAFFNQALAQYAYGINSSTSDIDVVNLATNQVVSKIATGVGQTNIDITPDNSRIFVTNNKSNTISVFNTSTNQIAAIIPTLSDPQDIKVSPDGGHMFIINQSSQIVLVYNANNYQPISTISSGLSPNNLVLSPDGKNLYWLAYKTGTQLYEIKHYNTVTNQLEEPVPVELDFLSYPILKISPDGTRLYAGNSEKGIYVVNLASRKLETKISNTTGASSFEISPDGNQLYLSKSSEKMIQIIETATNQTVYAIETEKPTDDLAISSDGNLIYAANSNDKAVTVINTVTRKKEATISFNVYISKLVLQKRKTTTPPASGQPNYEGFLDKVECGSIRGWVWDSKRPNTPLTVEILADGKVIGTASANIFRQDIKDAGKGNGEHVYSFSTPEQYKDGKTYSISARVQGSNYTLKSSPKTLTCIIPQPVDGPSCDSFTNYKVENGASHKAVSGVKVVGNTIYIATHGGLGISTDGGKTFTYKTTANGLGHNQVSKVYVVDNTIYAATYGGLSISTDGGNTFTNKTTANGLLINYILDVLVIGNTIYALPYGQGIAISTDGGNTFETKTRDEGLGARTVNGIYVVGNMIYAATTGGLSISSNGGRSFVNKTMANGLAANSVSGVYVVGKKVYASTGGRGISVSTDGGNTFTSRTTADGLGSNTVWGIFAQGNTVYAYTDKGLSISIDGGNTFTNKTIANGLGNDVVREVYLVDNKIYAATYGSLSYCESDVSSNRLTPSSSRIQSEEPAKSLQSNSAWDAVLLGNPVSTGIVEVEIKGAQGHQVKLSLIDSEGRVIGQTQVKITEGIERHRIVVRDKPPGLLLLQVSTPTHSKTLKVHNAQ
ncbi:beta-propeller fold lactonase family protein [Larkinella insperata]|uniref:Beta-propeller fold lactonase family protein n=1 Tax=Larkinella insperata TaxID=332158 RepID=A0ABW3Q9R9_9BACT|nr:beta-propeller fold lactonase family protein [Larkinella insperata]